MGQKQPNAFGLYDMLGNVHQLCSDWYGETYYKGSPSMDPQGPATGQARVSRGGSYHDLKYDVRSANRHHNTPDERYANLGFRVVAVPSEP